MNFIIQRYFRNPPLRKCICHIGLVFPARFYTSPAQLDEGSHQLTTQQKLAIKRFTERKGKKFVEDYYNFITLYECFKNHQKVPGVTARDFHILMDTIASGGVPKLRRNIKNRVAELYKVYEFMRQIGFTPTFETYKYLLSTLALQGRPREIDSLLVRAEKDGVMFDYAWIMGIKLEAYAYARDFNTAESIFTKLRSSKPDSELPFAKLMNAYVQLGRFEKFLVVHQDFVRVRNDLANVTEYSLRPLLLYYQKTGQYRKIIEESERLEVMNLDNDAQVWNFVIEAHMEVGDSKKAIFCAQQLFELLRTPKQRTLELTIELLTITNIPTFYLPRRRRYVSNLAIYMLELLDESRIIVNKTFYFHLVDALKRTFNVDTIPDLITQVDEYLRASNTPLRKKDILRSILHSVSLIGDMKSVELLLSMDRPVARACLEFLLCPIEGEEVRAKRRNSEPNDNQKVNIHIAAMNSIDYLKIFIFDKGLIQGAIGPYMKKVCGDLLIKLMEHKLESQIDEVVSLCRRNNIDLDEKVLEIIRKKLQMDNLK